MLSFKNPKDLLEILQGEREECFGQKILPSVSKILNSIQKYLIKKERNFQIKKEERKKLYV